MAQSYDVSCQRRQQRTFVRHWRQLKEVAAQEHNRNPPKHFVGVSIDPDIKIVQPCSGIRVSQGPWYRKGSGTSSGMASLLRPWKGKCDFSKAPRWSSSISSTVPTGSLGRGSLFIVASCKTSSLREVLPKSFRRQQKRLHHRIFFRVLPRLSSSAGLWHQSIGLQTIHCDHAVKHL